jgi:Zn-finger nucleic acid-binding protein
MLPLLIICPECMEAFETDALAVEYHCPRCRAVFYPGEERLGSDLVPPAT